MKEPLGTKLRKRLDKWIADHTPADLKAHTPTGHTQSVTLKETEDFLTISGTASVPLYRPLDAIERLAEIDED